MAKPRSVPVPDYPPILLSPMGSSWHGDQIDKCLDALAEHSKLDSRFSELPATGFGQRDSDQESKFWFGLAWALMRDFVPAFGKEVPKVGAPKKQHTKIDPLFPTAHDARLVAIAGAPRRMP